MKIRNALLIVLGLSVLLSACAAPQANAPTTDPTLMAQVVATLQANSAQTAAAQPTATTQPTYTPYPTYTPFPTETPAPPTATVPPATPVPTLKPTVAWVPTNTPTATPAAYACTITNNSVANGAKFDKNTDLDSNFTIKNTGTATWVSTDIDIIYVSGEKSMVKFDLYDLKSNVDPGNSFNLTIDLATGNNSGDYRIEFDMKHGSNFCPLVTNIHVN